MAIQHRVELLVCVCPIELQQRGNEATPFLIPLAKPQAFDDKEGEQKEKTVKEHPEEKSDVT